MRYSDAELRLLLRFATQGYETMLAATEELKAMIDRRRRASAPALRSLPGRHERLIGLAATL